MATSSFHEMISFCAAQTKKRNEKRKLSLHLGRCDASGFQGILAAGKAATGDDPRVGGDGEEGGAGGRGAVHHQGGRCQGSRSR